jgi:RimJ/RimL family protein N-acetyltransferase
MRQGHSGNAVFLETERMYFRQFCLGTLTPALSHRMGEGEMVHADARLLFELDSDPEVMRFISKGQPTPLHVLQTKILPGVLKYYEQSPPRGFWAAHLRDNREFIGWFHLRPDRIAPDEMELGYRLRRAVWGRGLATEGSQELVRRAFKEWRYEKVCGRTLLVNAASRRVLEKAGLTFEHEFFYGEDVLPGWAEEERRAVKYSSKRAKRDL